MTTPDKSPLTPAELDRRLAALLNEAEDLCDEMNGGGKNCPCCGLVLRSNMDDYQAKQALEACTTRIGKLLEKLRDGKWEGRQMGITITSAESARRGQ